MRILFFLFLYPIAQASPPEDPKFLAFITASTMAIKISESSTMNVLAHRMGLQPQDLRDYLADLKSQNQLRSPPPKVELDGTDIHLRFAPRSDVVIGFGEMENGFYTIDGKKLSIKSYLPYRKAKLLLMEPVANSKQAHFLDMFFSPKQAYAQPTFGTDVSRIIANAQASAVYSGQQFVAAAQAAANPTAPTLAEPDFMNLGNDPKDKINRTKDLAGAFIDAYTKEVSRQAHYKVVELMLITFKCDKKHHLAEMANWYPFWKGPPAKHFPFMAADVLSYKNGIYSYYRRDDFDEIHNSDGSLNGKFSGKSLNAVDEPHAKVAQVVNESGIIQKPPEGSVVPTSFSYCKPTQESDHCYPFYAHPRLAQACCSMPTCGDRVQAAVDNLISSYVDTVSKAKVSGSR